MDYLNSYFIRKALCYQVATHSGLSKCDVNEDVVGSKV